MSSKLQLNVFQVTPQVWRHLVNAYEGKAGMVYVRVKLYDPCLSALRLCMRSKWRNINTLFFLSFPFPGRGSRYPITAYYSFIDLERITG